MIKQVLILSFILFYTFFASAQNDLLNLKSANTVTTVAYFSINEARTFQVTETQEKFKNNSTKPKESKSAVYDLAFNIKDSTDTSYTMQMTYKNFQDNEEKSELKNLQEGIRKITENLTVEYRTDEVGIFDTITNLPELSKKIAEALDLTATEFLDKLEEKDTVKKALMTSAFVMMKEFFTKPENVEVLFLDDISTFHSIYGFELILAKPQEVDVMFSLFERKQINGTGTINLTGINKAKSDCKFDLTEKPDKEEMELYMNDLIQLFVPEKDIRKGKTENFKYNSTIKISYNMSLSTGWMDKVTSVTKINTTNNKDVVKILKKKEYKAY